MDLPKAARLVARISPDDAYIFDDVAKLDVPAAPAVHRVKLVCDYSILPEGDSEGQSADLRQCHGNAPGKTPGIIA